MDTALKNFIERSFIMSDNEAFQLLELIVGTLITDTEEGSLLEELEILYGNDLMHGAKDALFLRLQWLCNYYTDNYTTLADDEEDEDADE